MLCSSCSVAYNIHTHFDLTRKVKILGVGVGGNSVVFILLCDIHIFYWISLCLLYGWVWKDWCKRSYGKLYSFFFIHVFILGVSGWLIKESFSSYNRHYRVLWFSFLDHRWRLSVFIASSDLNEKSSLSGTSAPLLIQLYMWHIYLVLILSLGDLPYTLGPPEFCVQGSLRMQSVNTAAKNWRHTH